MKSNLFKTKNIAAFRSQDTGLKKCLTAFDLTLMGIGAIIGAGIFILTGIAAATKAGPSVVFSYVIAGTACSFTALAYAELASAVGGSGSAYGYAYASMGEFIAWFIGWTLLLEYGVSLSAVAIGWSGYFDNLLVSSLGFHIPKALLANPFEGGFINLPATILMLLLTVLLAIGVRESTRFNNVIVFTKLIAIAVFIGIAAFHVKPQNWHPFTPFGWIGSVKGAALIFFAYIGFDAVSTAADEAIDPQKAVPIGLISSLFICTILYVVVSGLLTGVAPYYTLNNPSPVAQVLVNLGFHLGAAIVSIGAIAGLTTVCLVMFYGLTRILFAMSRDGLLPALFSKTHHKTYTPVWVIGICGVITALIAGFAPIEQLAEIINIGTLSAFVIVCAGVIIMRRTHPEMIRPFKMPLSPYFPLIGMVLCLYLMMNLSQSTWIRFAIWTIVGLFVYFTYSRKHSLHRHQEDELA